MAGVPHRLMVDTELSHNLALLNDNFDKVVQDLRDLGADLSTTLTLSTGSLGATTLTSYGLYLLSKNSTAGYDPNRVMRTQSNLVSVSNSHLLPDIYVDGTAEANKWPDGSSIAPTANLHFFSVIDGATVPSDALARYVFQVNNRDASAHSYTLLFTAAYFRGGATGVFR